MSKTINLNKIKVKDIMSNNVVTCDIRDSISDAASLMANKNIHSLVIMDNNNPKFIISTFDILHAVFLESYFGDQDFLNSNVDKYVPYQILVSISPNETLQHALKLCSKHNIRSLPVVDNEELLGIISLMDIVRVINGEAEISKES